MNFLNIKYFIAIAEEQSISAAARKLYVSQQSLSEHLKKIENEVGVPLFNRNASLSLTVAGECFMEGAKEILNSYDRMISNIDNVTQNRRSKITIGVVTYGDPPFLADLLIQFMSKYPQYEATVVKRLHSDISHNMRGVDLYISYLPLDNELEHIFLIEHDPYCVLFHKELVNRIYGDRWDALEKELVATQNLALLKEMPFLILKDRLGQISLDLANIFTEYGFTPKVSFTSENGDINADMCLKGAGCLLAPTEYASRRFYAHNPKASQHLLSYPISLTSFHPALAICHEKGKHLHAAEICFINEAKAMLSNQTNR